jgi:DNA-binding transcriptional MerR regulator
MSGLLDVSLNLRGFGTLSTGETQNLLKKYSDNVEISIIKFGPHKEDSNRTFYHYNIVLKSIKNNVDSLDFFFFLYKKDVNGMSRNFIVGQMPNNISVVNFNNNGIYNIKLKLFASIILDESLAIKEHDDDKDTVFNIKEIDELFRTVSNDFKVCVLPKKEDGLLMNDKKFSSITIEVNSFVINKNNEKLIKYINSSVQGLGNSFYKLYKTESENKKKFMKVKLFKKFNVNQIKKIITNPNNVVKLDDGVTKSEDKVTKSDDEVTKSDDEVTKLDDEVTESDNKVTKSDDEVTKSDDKVTESEDKVTKSEDKVTKSDDEVTKSDDEVTKSDDEVTKSDDEVTKSDDEVTKSDDKVTESDDEVTKSDDKVTKLDEVSVLIDPVSESDNDVVK